MAIESVPWMIGGGAQHSNSVARTLAYAAVGGGEGIIRATDCRVTAASSPAGKVVVKAGGFAILGTYANQSSQSYVGRVLDDTEVSVSSTGGSARSDIIAVRIDDPEYGGSIPSNPAVGPYSKLVVIPNVGATATKLPSNLGFPAVALARVDLPAGTTNITNAMVTDLRKMAQRWTQRSLILPGDRLGYLTSTNTANGQIWPSAARAIEVPDRATTARIVVSIAGVRVNTGAQGRIFQRLGTVTGATSTFDAVDVSSWQRLSMMNAQVFNIPPELRGTTVAHEMRAYVSGGSGNNRPYADTTGTEVVIDVEFSEEPSAS